MSYAAPLSRLARSRARADPHPSPQPDIVILSISARFVPRKGSGTTRCNPLASIASDANWVNVLSRTAMRSKGFPRIVEFYMREARIFIYIFVYHTKKCVNAKNLTFRMTNVYFSYFLQTK